MDNVDLPMPSANALESPVFVVGPVRSGTTLLRILLNHHPEINNFGEFEEAVSQVVNNSFPVLENFHRYLSTDRAFLSKKLTVNRQLSYRELILDLLLQQYNKNPQPIISASVHSNIHALPLIWPAARYIHLSRDPRDVARSCIGMGWVGNVYHGAAYWLAAEKKWDLLVQKVSREQILNIKYENLVTDPEASLSEICRFLGIDYSSDMLEIDQDTTYDKPSAKYANQWKTKLTDDQIELVECQCKALMLSRGYDLQTQADTPSTFKLFKLGAQNRLFRLSFNIKRYGFGLWALWVFSKRLPPNSFSDSIKLKVNEINKRHLK